MFDRWLLHLTYKELIVWECHLRSIMTFLSRSDKNETNFDSGKHASDDQLRPIGNLPLNCNAELSLHPFHDFGHISSDLGGGGGTMINDH